MISRNLAIAMVAGGICLVLKGVKYQSDYKKDRRSNKSNTRNTHGSTFLLSLIFKMIGVAKFFYSCRIYGMPEKVINRVFLLLLRAWVEASL